MAEAAFKQMIATFIRQTRPQSFRHGKPLRYPQRTITGLATSNKPSHPIDEQPSQWQAHGLPTDSVTTESTSRLERLRKEPEPRSFSSFLTDTHSRQHNYLRISVTERCNLRCLYCMPEEGVALSPPSHILTTPEIVHLSSLFVSQGVDKIRLTGGEPTVRKDIVDLMHQIGKLRANGLKELCLTTNGISLHRKLDAMVDAGLTGVNLSLDTLDPFQFTLMTRRNGHEAVMKSIHRILDLNKAGAGIKLKINCVVMRGVNEREILPFVDMGQDQDLEVRFIEYMPFDGNKWSQKKMLSFQEMLAMIQEKYPNVHKVQGHTNDTSKTYQIPGFQGRIGFITSMTHNFCGTCNRLRITSDGNLKVCLFGNSEVSLRDILRESNDGHPIDAEAMDAIKQLEMAHQPSATGHFGHQAFSERDIRLLDVIGAAVKRKKAKHAGMGELENMKNRPMILIDGENRSMESLFHPSICLDSPMLHASLSRRQRTAIPLHLLGPQKPTYVQTRSISTEIIRKVPSQAFYRKVPKGESSETAVQNEPGSERTRLQQIYDDQVVQVSKLSAMANAFESETQPLTHLDESGAARMVDITAKKVTSRTATAEATLFFSSPATLDILESSTVEKGDAVAVARVAAIQAAKKTPDLIPLAHPALGLTGVTVTLRTVRPRASSINGTSFEEQQSQEQRCGVTVRATVSCHGKTGVEMEALTSATVATLTLYDMLKGVDKGMEISNAYVKSKSGGKSGDWVFNPKTKQIMKGKGSITDEQEMHAPSHNISKADDNTQPTTNEVSPSTNAVADDPTNTNPNNETSQINSGVSMRVINELPDNQRVALAKRLLRNQEEHLRTWRQRLKLQERQFDHEQHKWRLTTLDIEQEVRRRADQLVKDRTLSSTSKSKSPAQQDNNSQLSSITGSDAQNTTHTTGAQSSTGDSITNGRTDELARPSEDQHRQNKSHQSPNNANPSHFTDGASTEADAQIIKFDRTSRDIMSGTYSDRMDRQAFQVKRVERYEDWARGR